MYFLTSVVIHSKNQEYIIITDDDEIAISIEETGLAFIQQN